MGFAVVAFLWIGAAQTLRMAELSARAAGLRLGQLLRSSLYLPSHTPVAEAVRQTAETGAGGIVVIDGQGRSRALVDEAQIAQLPADRRPWTSLAQVARELEPGLILSEELRRPAHRDPAPAPGLGVPGGGPGRGGARGGRRRRPGPSARACPGPGRGGSH